jgi:hypothetical protein
MRKEIIVIDGFYENPDKIRKEALSMEYNVQGNYPGTRTDTLPYGDVRQLLESVMNIKIDEEKWSLGEYTGTYQYVVEGAKTWVHADFNNDWSCIVYLSPDPIGNSGTSFYKHKETGSRSYLSSPEIEGDGNNDDAWIKTDVIANVFNRAVIFRGDLWHRADDYFGKDLKSGRLFQTFFFDEE